MAYHYLIGQDGTIDKMHRDEAQRPHTSNQSVNLNSIAIALEGNFDEQYPSEDQIDSLRALISSLRAKHGYIPVIAHRDASSSRCPGKHITDAFIQSFN